MKTKYEKMNEAMEREGDPSDDQLNGVEEKLLWPRIVENRVNHTVCKKELEVVENCMKKYGFAFSFLCVLDRIFYVHCTSKHKSSEDVKDDCLEEYLALRSKYRLTKDTNVLNRMKAMAFPSQYENKTQSHSKNC